MQCFASQIGYCNANAAEPIFLLQLRWPEHELTITTPQSSVTREFLAGFLDYAAATNEELMKYAKAQKNYYPGMSVTEALTAAILWEGSLTTLDSLAADLVVVDPDDQLVITIQDRTFVWIYPSDGKISRDERIVPTGTPSSCH
eukprot:GHVU01073581.1.p1 GENE.GHVU01073581.1~~GHVU01073581.1.p1  ORF type:complete len:144 (-),score=20.58 GHVU01073581.1:400-831(-)